MYDCQKVMMVKYHNKLLQVSSPYVALYLHLFATRSMIRGSKVVYFAVSLERPRFS